MRSTQVFVIGPPSVTYWAELGRQNYETFLRKSRITFRRYDSEASKKGNHLGEVFSNDGSIKDLKYFLSIFPE